MREINMEKKNIKYTNKKRTKIWFSWSIYYEYIF
jgi:hypothetical protein